MSGGGRASLPRLWPLSNSLCTLFFSSPPSLSVVCRLMGKVRAAVELQRTPEGGWMLPQAPTHRAIKEISKECLTKHVTLRGVRVQEDPLAEVRVLRHLSQPAPHPNVLQVIVRSAEGRGWVPPLFH